jgi:hypothetical protein
MSLISRCWNSGAASRAWIREEETAIIGRGTHGVDHASDRMNFRRALASETLYAGIQTLRGAVVSFIGWFNPVASIQAWFSQAQYTADLEVLAAVRFPNFLGDPLRYLQARCRLSTLHFSPPGASSTSFLKNSRAVGIGALELP